ncbi:RDD family protein, partial [Streptomyces sp. NPDC054901]
APGRAPGIGAPTGSHRPAVTRPGRPWARPARGGVPARPGAGNSPSAVPAATRRETPRDGR